MCCYHPLIPIELAGRFISILCGSTWSIKLNSYGFTAYRHTWNNRWNPPLAIMHTDNSTDDHPVIARTGWFAPLGSVSGGDRDPGLWGALSGHDILKTAAFHFLVSQSSGSKLSFGYFHRERWSSYPVTIDRFGIWIEERGKCWVSRSLDKGRERISHGNSEHLQHKFMIGSQSLQ